MVASNDTVVDADFPSSGAMSDVWVSDTFEVDGSFRRHLKVETRTSLSRYQGQIHVALINQDNGRVYLPLNTTGSNSTTGSVYNTDIGTYVARVEVARPKIAPNPTDVLHVTVVRDPITGFPCFAFFYPFLIPIVIALGRASFESRRWAESDYAG
jgi:hypothetical protein